MLMDEPDTQLAFSEGQQITDMFEQTPANLQRPVSTGDLVVIYVCGWVA